MDTTVKFENIHQEEEKETKKNMITSILVEGDISRIYDDATKTIFYKSTIYGQLHQITPGCRLKIGSLFLTPDFPNRRDPYATMVRQFSISSNLCTRPAFQRRTIVTAPLEPPTPDTYVQELRSQCTPLILFTGRVSPRDPIFVESWDPEYYTINTATNYCEFYIEEIPLAPVSVPAGFFDYGYKALLYLSIEIPE